MATSKLFSFSLLAASALAISTPALADSKTIMVKYDDLDLSTATGQQRLMTRVKMAVKQVCASPRAITLEERIDQNTCTKVSAANAMPKVQGTIAAYMENRRLASREMTIVAGN